MRKGDPIRVTSLDPVRDAKSVGHDIGMSRAVIDAKFDVIDRKLRKLYDETSVAAIGDDERELRVESLLVGVKWACDGILDDFAALERCRTLATRRGARCCARPPMS